MQVHREGSQQMIGIITTNSGTRGGSLGKVEGEGRPPGVEESEETS